MNKTLIIIIILLVFLYFLTNIETFKFIKESFEASEESSKPLDTEEECNGPSRYKKGTCSKAMCEKWAEEGMCTSKNPEDAEYMRHMCPIQCRLKYNLVEKIYNENEKLQKDIYDMDPSMINNLIQDLNGITPELKNLVSNDLQTLGKLGNIELENIDEARELIKKILQSIIIPDENKVILEVDNTLKKDTLEKILCNTIKKYNKNYECPIVSDPLQENIFLN